MAIQPFEIGVCSWSLQVGSIPELVGFCNQLGVDVVQLACGDPHHASWSEGDDLPNAAKNSGLRFSGTMIGFPGEDYTTPATIEKTGGFGDPATRGERLERFAWAVERTVELGLKDIMCHGGFLPEPDAPDRKTFLDTLTKVADIAAQKDVTVAFETGQETAKLLRRTLDDLKMPNLKVNFDPANMLLYDKGDPIEALGVLGSDVRSVHLKDAIRPKTPGEWGTEVPLGHGQANIPRFVKKLKEIGFTGPLCIEREVGNQQERLRDIAHGVRYLKECLA